MKLLSELTDYNHPNIYVKRAKITESIKAMQCLSLRQYHDKVIQIPPYILRDQIKKAQNILQLVNTEISRKEQQCFKFGEPF
jgi:hypothetical protein